MKAQPLIAVRDVAASRVWYETVLGLQGRRGGDEYEQLCSAGELVLQLHRWDAHDRPGPGLPTSRTAGHGVLLWFHDPDVGAAHQRAQDAGAKVLQALALNPRAGFLEFWIEDPDGYVVVIAGREGEVATPPASPADVPESPA